MDAYIGCFSGVTLAIGRLMRIEKTFWKQVISKSTLSTGDVQNILLVLERMPEDISWCIRLT